MIIEVACPKGTPNHELKDNIIISKAAKETYNFKYKARINKDIKEEIKITKEILSHPKKYSFKTHITHIVNRDSYFTTLGNPCIEAGVGFS